MNPAFLLEETLPLFTVLYERVMISLCPLEPVIPEPMFIATVARLFVDALEGKCGACLLTLNISKLFPFK